MSTDSKYVPLATLSAKQVKVWLTNLGYDKQFCKRFMGVTGKVMASCLDTIMPRIEHVTNSLELHPFAEEQLQQTLSDAQESGINENLLIDWTSKSLKLA